MVLAAEEALKSLFLAVLSDGIELPPRALAAVLTQHKPRHFTGALMVLMRFFAVKWIELLSSLNEDHPDPTTSAYADARKTAVAGLVTELNALADAEPGEADVIDEMDWWKRSDTLKQRGFYVDFANGTWLAPSSVTERDYAEAHRIAADTVGSMEQAISMSLAQSQASRRDFAETMNRLLRAWRGRSSDE